MFEKRTDLALEARELWQESAGKTTRLPGVKARETKLQGYPLTRVDILDEAGEQALGKPVGSYRTLDLTAFWQRGNGFFDRAVQAAGQQLRELLPEQGTVLVAGWGKRAMTPDAVLVDVEQALQALAELTGRTMREDLLNRIFARFCVGK